MRFQNHRGFSLVELMVSIAIVGFVSAGAALLILSSKSEENSTVGDFWIEVRRNEILSILRNDTQFGALVALNGSPMNCMKQNGGCPNIVANNLPLKLNITGPQGKDLLDGFSPNLGFTKNGDICNTFDPVNGDDQCPYGVRLTWSLICASSQLCRNPEAIYNVQFRHHPAKGLPKNLDKFKISVLRGQKMNSVCEVCQSSLGGQCMPFGQCDLSAKFLNCPAGQFATGFDNNGQTICTAMNMGACPAGQVAVGFNNGELVCGAGCL